jgi:hypothetical protein
MPDSVSSMPIATSKEGDNTGCISDVVLLLDKYKRHHVQVVSTQGCVTVKITPTDDPSMYVFHVHHKDRLLCNRSLFIFDLYGPVRQHGLWIVEWKWFDRFILFLILFSSTLLALNDSRHPDAAINQFAEACDPVLTVFFTVECLLKILAWGFCLNKNSYLRSAWNWLDLIVVLTGLIGLLPSVGLNLRFLLVFKVLRPLRSLTVMPQMRLLVNTVLLSIKRLGQFCIMVVFLFSVFSIVGLNFWAGVTYRQCRETKDPEWDKTLQCWKWDVPEVSSGRLCGGRYMCEAGHRCGSLFAEEAQESLRPNFGNATWTPGRVPGEGAPWCASTLNTWDSAEFNYHFTHFDHMPGALLLIFQCMTMEGWVDLMYSLQDGDSDIVASVYFVCMVTCTAFFLLNAALAIVTETFEDAMGGDGDEQEPQSVEAEGTSDQWAAPRQTGQSNHSPQVVPEKDAVVEDVSPGGKGLDKASMDPDEIHAFEDEKSYKAMGISKNQPGEDKQQVETTPLRGDEGKLELPANEEDDKSADGDSPEEGKAMQQANTAASAPPDDEDDENFMEDQDWSQAPWLDSAVVRTFRTVASNDWFVNIIMLFILLNVVTMCLDTYPPPPAVMQQFLGVCNYVFAVVFTLEMSILLVALGPRLYWTQAVTAFDGIVVIAGWVEISMSGGGGAVRAFRGLRLLRIFKLAKKWTSFRVIMKAIKDTVASLGNLGVLLFIMIFIFTLMGREFFALRFQFDDNGHLLPDAGKPSCHGKKDDYDCVPRAHFDTFLWAFVTVFQILTGENWNAIMYDGMKTHVFMVAYFVLVMVFGQFIMLSLFLAVLMSKFEESREANQAADEKKKKKQKIGKRRERFCLPKDESAYKVKKA